MECPPETRQLLTPPSPLPTPARWSTTRWRVVSTTDEASSVEVEEVVHTLLGTSGRGVVWGPNHPFRVTYASTLLASAPDLDTALAVACWISDTSRSHSLSPPHLVRATLLSPPPLSSVPPPSASASPSPYPLSLSLSSPYPASPYPASPHILRFHPPVQTSTPYSSPLPRPPPSAVRRHDVRVNGELPLDTFTDLVLSPARIRKSPVSTPFVSSGSHPRYPVWAPSPMRLFVTDVPSPPAPAWDDGDAESADE